MADNTQLLTDLNARYGNAAHVAAPTAQEPAPAQQPAAPDAAKRDATLADLNQRYAGAKQVTKQENYAGDIADATETALNDKARVEYIPPDQNTWLGYLGRVGRSTLFGQASDLIAARALQDTFQDQLPDLTYSEALKAVRAGYEKEGTDLSATILGGLATGGIAAKAGTAAATKAGMLTGATKWLANNPVTSRILGAAAAGAGGGAIEEGVRSSLAHSLDAGAGADLHGWDVAKDAALGGLVGGIMSPAAQEALRVQAAGFRYVGGLLGATGVQADQAGSRVIKALAKEGETPADTVGRLNQEAAGFMQRNGYAPAIADLASPDQVADVASVVKNVTGLHMRTAELGEQGVKRALKAWDSAITSGAKTESPEQIQAAVEDLFTDVTRRNGSKLVEVPADTMATLMDNRDWIGKLAKASAKDSGARKIANVLDAQAGVADLKRTFSSYAAKRDIASRWSDVAELSDQIAKLRSAAFNESELEPSALAQLRNLEQLGKAATNLVAKRKQFGDSKEAEATARNLMMKAQSLVDDYETNGLKITLRDANDIRATASRYAYATQDPFEQGVARQIRDAVSPVGVKEVPEYGDVVKRWHSQNTRAEAQATGAQAAQGSIDLGDLETRLRAGRLPDKPRVSGDALGALRQGAEEGAVRDLQHAARSDTMSAVNTANKVAKNQNIREGLQMVAPARAQAITERAEQVVKTYKNMAAAQGPKSKTALEKGADALKDAATGALFGGVGGAAKAHLAVRMLMRLYTPRGTAKKMVEMLMNPDEAPKALAYMERKGIRLGAFFGALAANTAINGKVE